MIASSSSQSTPYAQVKPARGRRARAASPARRAGGTPRRLFVAGGAVELCAGGEIRTASKTFAFGEALFEVEMAPGLRASKAPGKDFVLTEIATGRMTGYRYVKKRGAWFNSTAQVLRAMSAPLAPSARRPWWRRMAGLLLSWLAFRNVWAARQANACGRYFTLHDDGRVELAGGTFLQAGDSPALLASGQTLARNGLDVTLHAENGDVVERWRRSGNASGWLRLVTRRRSSLGVLGVDGEVASDGALSFSPAGALAFTLKGEEPFTLHLCAGRTLVRPMSGSQIFVLRADGNPVREFFIRGARVFEQQAAQDQWIYDMVGCPGGIERPKHTVEIAPGAISVCDTGEAIVLGRCYLPGEEFSIRSGGIRVERAAGLWAPFYLRTATSVVGYVYAQDGEWWRLVPRVPDRRYLCPKRFGAVGNYVSFSFQWVEMYIAEAPGMVHVDRWLMAVARTAEGFAAQPLLLYVGIFMAVSLGVAVIGGYWATRLAGVGWSAVWRAYRHVRRAWELAR